MKISYNWLRRFIDFDYTPDQLSQALTDCGLEVEHVERWESLKGGLKGIVIGKVLTCERHPNADRLSVTTVDVGDGTPRHIVCGAPNVAAGQTVVVALPGAVLYPASGESFEIKKSKIRGEVSEGMICAEDEIGLGTSHAGIMILPDALAPGMDAAGYFKIEEDYIFEIGLTPNRSDAASHLGVARDVRALLCRTSGAEIKMPDISGFREGNQPPQIQVEIENAEACPRYSGIEITQVKVGPSPEWLQNRLKAVGLRPINNVVDITNYVMLDLGQPLHAFDAAKISGGKIIVRNLPAGTRFQTLDETERELQGHELMITDANGGLCIAGVFGGVHSGVTDATTHIFLESAYFHPVHVRKSAKAHGLHTDSSFRFERGTDPEMTLTALKQAALMICEIAGGVIKTPVTDLYPHPIERKKVNFSFGYLKTIIGDEIARHDVLDILASLDIQVEEDQSDWLILSVPAYRVDVTRNADIAEEILRIYGYNSIDLPKKFSITPGKAPKPDPEKVVSGISGFLVSMGFKEMLNNSLGKLSHLEILPLPEGLDGVQVLNPLSNDLSLMRHHMLLTGLETIAYNINRQQKNLRVFETGKTYFRKDKRYLEEHHLSIWVTGDMIGEHWSEKKRGYDIYFLKAIVEQSLATTGTGFRKRLTIREESRDGLEETLSWYDGKRMIASAGKVKKAVLKAMDIAQPVWYAEIRLETLVSVMDARDQEIPGPPKFPEVRRDLSMMLDRSVRYADLETLAFASEPKLLRQVNLFDVYEGDKIEQGKKSYAVSFILRDDESTLQDKQIDGVMEKLMKQFEGKLGAVIRKG